MDRAINKETGELLDALNLHDNSSHPNPLNEKWIAPKDKILNWDDEEMKDRDEEPVHYVKSKDYTHWNPEKAKKGIRIFQPPCFALYPNSPAKTVAETPVHKALKKFIFNTLIINDLKLTYATLKKKTSYKKYLTISELKKKGYLDLDNYSIEVNAVGYKTLRADILLPFKKHHEFLGNGIAFEIQIQSQKEKKTFDRSIKWALNKYSVVWLFGNDFNFNKDLTEIELKKDNVKLFTYINELYYGKKTFCKNLDENVKENSRKLDIKISELKNKSDKMISGINDSLKNSREDFEEVYEDVKKRINGFFGSKIKEISKNFGDEVAKKVQNNFFHNNYEEIEEILEQSFERYLQHNELKKIEENVIHRVNWDNIILKIEEEMKKNIENKLKFYYSWKTIIENTPCCPYCKKNMLKLVLCKRGTADEKYKFVCEDCGTWVNLPAELEKQKLNGDDYGE